MATEIKVKIANDYYKASIDIIRDPEDEKDLTMGMIEDCLREKSVTFGIKYEAIQAAIDSGESHRDLLVAEGIPHENGSDADIEFKFQVSKNKKPEILEDGTVDYKNMGYLVAVAEGDVLAVKTPRTEGKDGTSVTGRTIAGRAGRDMLLKFGKNVKLSDDKLSLISEIDGRLQFDGEKVSVFSFLEIQGDVGVKTGNLNFTGDVLVNGDVIDGYKLEVTGDLTINGIVEGAELVVGGDLVISSGVQGHDDAKIKVGGDLTVGFLNSAHVMVKGNIEANSIMNSIVECDGKMELLGKQGQLVGGEIVCKGDIEAKTIGSNLEIMTVIKLGLDFKIISEIKELSETIKEYTAKVDIINTEIKGIANKLSIQKGDARLIKLLSGQKKQLDKIQPELEEKRVRYRFLQEFASSIMNSKIKAGRMYPGTRITIGNSNYYVKFIVENMIIRREKGEIKEESF